MKILLPHLGVMHEYTDYSPSRLNDILRESLAASAMHPCYLELDDGARQCFLFFRENQIYSAGKIEDIQFSEIHIKDFLVSGTSMNFPHVRIYETNNKILHSILILFQKKPSLKLLTSFVDLDQVLDKIEEEGKSCIVSASQDCFLALLRYEKGKVTALCHELSSPAPKERNFREDFLVKIYTLSAEKPLAIGVYDDLMVKYAKDAKMIEEEFQGDIVALFLSKPPVVTLEFKGKEIERYVLDKPVLKIGRTPDNDIVIDNLAVSRLHAMIEEDKGSYYIKDCDSLNGTLLNQKKVGRAKLKFGDAIVIGKHKLSFYRQEGQQSSSVEHPDNLDQTIIMQGGDTRQKSKIVMEAPGGPRLIEKSASGEKVIELNKPSLVFGKDGKADVGIDGLFVAERHAEIVRENGNFVIRHLGGLRKVKVGGKPVKERVLKNNDEIQIGNKAFIFRE